MTLHFEKSLQDFLMGKNLGSRVVYEKMDTFLNEFLKFSGRKKHFSTLKKNYEAGS